ncbi:MAG: WhiB family transcriptional regulator [Rhodoglobus sp.]
MNTDARLAAGRTAPHRGRWGARHDHPSIVSDTPLQRAIIALARDDRKTPCADRQNLFMASDRKTRLEAEVWCTGCPVIGPCGDEADANGEKFGTWGGKDRTPR